MSSEKRRQKHFGMIMLRDCAAMKQIDFATLIGIPLSTLGALESGTREITIEQAELVFLVTGASPVELLKHKGPPKEAWSDDVYTLASWERWNLALRGYKPPRPLPPMEVTAEYLLDLLGDRSAPFSVTKNNLVERALQCCYQQKLKSAYSGAVELVIRMARTAHDHQR
jgi:transcriptional regulator with XRE-family HTH domain